MKATLIALALALLTFISVKANEPERVDLALVLAIDCSYSVDEAEFIQQIAGTARAFLDPRVFQAIQEGPRQSIAVTVMQWSSHTQQHQVVPWRRIQSQQDLFELADEISQLTRQTAEGGTSISAAILEGMALLDTAPYKADRWVIDISADGENNNGPHLQQARGFAFGKGITLNGLTILNEVGYLNHYFQNRVIGGEGAFVEIAADYTAYADAILRKILREIKGLSLG